MPEQCPQLAKLSGEARKFWEGKQTEAEDTLIRFSYAILTVPAELAALDKSGILYLMKKNLWFEDFPKPPAFISFGKPPEYKKTLIQMPLATLEKFESLAESEVHTRFRGKQHNPGFLQNFAYFLGVNPRYLLFSGKLANGSSFQYAFREIEGPQAWLQALAELLATPQLQRVAEAG